MNHTYHADGCKTNVPPRMLMCLVHWRRLRKPMQDAIWAEYRPGQERDKEPSLRYLAVQQRAIAEVAFKPNDEDAARRAAPYLLRSNELRKECLRLGLGDPLDNIAGAPS